MKLRNKLILSCAALAAVATTAVSTTYAWYTANTTVTADGVSGSTKSSDDATLLISTTGAVGTWGSKVSLNINPETLVPVAYHEATTGTNATPAGYKKAGTTTIDEVAATAGTDYITFSLYFKSGSTDNLTVTLTDFNLVEKAGNVLNPKMVLNETGLTQTNAGPTYTCNLFRALTYVEEIGASTEVASGSVATFNGTPVRTAYDVEYAANDHDADTAGKQIDSLAANCNAHNYYNAVKGLASGDTGYITSQSNSEALTVLTAANAENRALSQTGAGSLTGMSPILRVDFTFYLDGWDLYCFDAVQGQGFTLDMEFQGAKYTAPAPTDGE